MFTKPMQDIEEMAGHSTRDGVKTQGSLFILKNRWTADHWKT